MQQKHPSLMPCLSRLDAKTSDIGRLSGKDSSTAKIVVRLVSPEVTKTANSLETNTVMKTSTANIYYAIKQVGQASIWPNRFEVAKFVVGEVQPQDVYDVEIYANGTGECNCPAGRYHNRIGTTDKHVTLTKAWIADGRPSPAICSI